MYLYPKWLRLWHLINAILIIILIVSGISIHFEGKENSLLLMEYSKAVRWHDLAAKIMTVSYIAFVAGNIFTENGRYYRLKRKNFRPDIVKQFRYYSVGMFKGEKKPFPITLDRKFNPLQKLSYFLIMYISLPLIIISGIVMMLPEVTVNRILGAGGLMISDLLHIIMGFLVSIFLIIHVYTCTLGSTPTSLFRGMISGYQESDED